MLWVGLPSFCPRTSSDDRHFCTDFDHAVYGIVEDSDIHNNIMAVHIGKVGLGSRMCVWGGGEGAYFKHCCSILGGRAVSTRVQNL